MENLYRKIYEYFTVSISFKDKRLIVNDILEYYGINGNYHLLDNVDTSIEDLTRQLVKIINPKPKVDNTHLIG